jgi:tetratricopeptide (TPR) repeat protein
MKHPLLSISLSLSVLLPSAALAQEHKHVDHALGSVTFSTGCNPAAQKLMNTGVAMLHSFWLTEARKTFEAAAQADAGCGIAYWGVALTHFGNPFAGGPGPDGLKAGLAAAEKGVSIGGKTPRDQAYVDAALKLYKDYETVDSRTRMRAYGAALKQIAAANPNDVESQIFAAFWMVPNASATDLTFAEQKKAADVLNPLFAKYPQHPGLAHYIIHAFDSPPLAQLALDAAKSYATIAPDAPHALHMPSHTFTRLGLWEESIKTNRRAADLEPTAGAKAHPADYMVYAYLQKGQDDAAKKVLDEVGINPTGVDGTGAVWVGSYNAVAMAARYALERDDWAGATQLAVPTNQPAFIQSIARFSRALGHARQGHAAPAREEIAELTKLTSVLTERKDPYWPIVVDAQRMAAEAWVLHAEGKHAEALAMAAQAADKEELVEKHPVTPGPLIPARELLGDILMVHGKHAEALAAYEQTLKKEPNRLRTLAGAARAAKAAGKADVAAKYQAEVKKLIDPGSPRAKSLLSALD